MLCYILQGDEATYHGATHGPGFVLKARKCKKGEKEEKGMGLTDVKTLSDYYINNNIVVS